MSASFDWIAMARTLDATGATSRTQAPRIDLARVLAQLRRHGLGSKGCVVFSSEPLYEYRDYATKVDEELSTLSWLYHMNHGIFMTPGVDEQWTLSVAHSDDELQRYVDAYEAFARDVTA